MSVARRRDLLGAAAFSGFAAVAVAGFAWPDQPAILAQPAPDAELIALCDRFNELEREIIATYGMLDDEHEDEEDALRAPMEQAQKPLFEKIMGLRATTIEGHRARAAMFRLWYSQLEGEGRSEGFWAGRMAWALVRDVLDETA